SLPIGIMGKAFYVLKLFNQQEIIGFVIDNLKNDNGQTNQI
ncbi:MAG: hypothetical protein ACJA1Z_003592, partial [Patiriisocius sp.]